MYKFTKLAHLIKVMNSLINCAFSETSPSFLRTRLLVFPPAPLESQHPIRSNSIRVVLNSTAVFWSIPHCMFSLFACTSAFCCGTVLISDVTTLVSASLGTLRTKRTHVSEESDVGLCQCVVGRVLPDVRYIRKHKMHLYRQRG